MYLLHRTCITLQTSMSTLTRKNLMVDDAKLKRLSAQRGLSESATVRELVDLALAAGEIGEVFRELQRRGGVDDVFERLPEAERRRLGADRHQHRSARQQERRAASRRTKRPTSRA